VPNKYFQIDGVATHVHHQGATTLPGVSPDLSRGEVLLCLHGAGGNGAQFEPLAARLAAQHSPVAFDQPGHGRSGELDSLGSIERMAAFASSFAEALSLPPRVLVGHSMGGAVALQMALGSPESVRALVLVGSGAHIPLPEEVVTQSRLVTEGKARRQFVKEIFSPKASPEVMRQNFMEDLKTDPRTGHGDLLAVQAFDLRSRLAELKLPVLVVRGDAELLEAQSAELAEKIEGARSEVIPDAGHMVTMEQPEALADAIGAFLKELA
jgi:pimeloyl-ACP methyl ester carboxylesterase